MIKSEKKVIFSQSEPPKEVLWLRYKDGTLTLENYGSKGWESIQHTADESHPEEPEEVKYVFHITNDDEALEQANIHTAARIGHNKYTTVELKGTYYSDEYDMYGYFYDGIIYTVFGEFDVNYDTGVVSLIYKGDNTTAIELQVASSGSAEADENLKLLMQMSIYPVFLCRFENGYGTATFNSNNGGSAFITTATGAAVLYTITAEGVITKAGEYDLTTNPV